MRFRSLSLAGLALVGIALTFGNAAADKKSNPEFWKTWSDRKATNLQKRDAVESLMGGREVAEEYIEVLESDVWQYRATITGRIQNDTNKELLAALEDFLFNEKEIVKKPAAAEHICWALYNNQTWVNAEKWSKSRSLIVGKKTPDKVKARMLRELGVFRGAPDLPEPQAQAKANVKLLVDLLEWAASDKKFDPVLRFLMGDALESLSSQDFGEDLAKWRFFADGLKDTEPLKPRTAEGFKDQFEDVEVEGHSFSAPQPRPVDMEILILPDLGKSDRYWYQYIFEINKTFKCTFVKLPDCSKMNGIEWMKNRDGTDNRTAYYYPLAQLVETFEERRKQSKQKQIGLIAHGVSGWIALEYLRLHPESVAFAIIIQTWSGESSREMGRNATEQSKDDAYKYYAQSLVYDPSGRIGALSLNDEQQYWARTGSGKRRWADPKALEPLFYASQAYNVQSESNARILVPRYEFEDAVKGSRKIDVPTLFIHGVNDPMFVKKDEASYRKGFGNMTWAAYENSADSPWAEEPLRFFEDFQTMLDKNDIIAKLKKQDEERKKEEEGK